MTNPQQEAQAFLNDLLRDVNALVAQRIAAFRPNLAQGTGVLPASAIPASDPGFIAVITDIVGELPGGFTDPTTDEGDLIYRDATHATRLPIGDEGQVLTVEDGEPAWADAGSGAFPTHATLWHDEAIATAGTAISTQDNAAYAYGRAALQDPPANGDTFHQTFVLAAGTYTLSVLSLTANNRGIIDWSIDGVPVLTGQDWYASGTTILVKTGSVTITTSGVHTLTGVINGKNGASSNYYMALTKYWIA